MKKYFCVSDIHGFFFELKRALHEAGFNKKNPEHILIVCGDIADRGPNPKEVYEFLKSSTINFTQVSSPKTPLSKTK